MDQRRGGYPSVKSGSEKMILGGNFDQGWELKVFSAGFGGLSLGNMLRWMDTREETIISEGLVHVGGLRETKEGMWAQLNAPEACCRPPANLSLSGSKVI
jgi:hypothetical protein